MRSEMFGYGSHSFLNEYIRRKRCKKIMEIGVADGGNARKMVIIAGENFPIEEIEYYGFDIFRFEDDYRKVESKFEKIGCKFSLFKGDSVEILPKNVKKLPKMDLIFIDGGHSYLTVKNDWENSRRLMHDDTAVFFHNINFSGPKRVVNELCSKIYEVKILDPPSDCKTALVQKKFPRLTSSITRSVIS